jgi:DNA-binding beta-propeller fold protein YncE
MRLLGLVLLLVGCHGAVPYADNREAPCVPPATVEHIGSLACRDEVTGLEFSPLGIAFDIMDDLYVVDSDHARIYKAGKEIESLVVFCECPSEFPRCEFVDLAPAETGGLYVSERLSGSVLDLDRWGDLAAFVETGPGTAGISAAKGGRVFAALGIEGSIVMADFGAESGVLESRVSGADGDAYPVDCCALPDGMVAVTDAFARKVLFLTAVGEVRGAARGFDFERPFGVACLGAELMFVSDSDRGMIAVFDAEGDFFFAFGEGTLETPTFIAVRTDGTICVSDIGKMTVEVFKIDLSSEE